MTDLEELSSRRAQTSAAREAAIEAKRKRRESEADAIALAIERLVKAAPPFSPEQSTRLRELLASNAAAAGETS